MVEAGKCFAVNRYTACVFHSMRVLESGLNSICGQLGYTPKNENWHRILEDLPAEIHKKYSPHSGAADWRDWEQFYSEATLEFRYVKNAWRNYVMHARDLYAIDEALKIFDHTVGLMDHLSERLSG
jgi:hypothetical protein